MPGCSDCFGTMKEVQSSMSSVMMKAKEFAVESKSMVILYQDDSGEVQYMLFEKARELGLRPIEYVSPIQRS